ncbi:hypothetical protein Trydic_g2550 [Trypoxylus dichotomus]
MWVKKVVAAPPPSHSKATSPGVSEHVTSWRDNGTKWISSGKTWAVVIVTDLFENLREVDRHHRRLMAREMIVGLLPPPSTLKKDLELPSKGQPGSYMVAVSKLYEI